MSRQTTIFEMNYEGAEGPPKRTSRYTVGKLGIPAEVMDTPRIPFPMPRKPRTADYDFPPYGAVVASLDYPGERFIAFNRTIDSVIITEWNAINGIPMGGEVIVRPIPWGQWREMMRRWVLVWVPSTPFRDGPIAVMPYSGTLIPRE